MNESHEAIPRPRDASSRTLLTWKRVYIILCLVLSVPVAYFAFCRPYWCGFDFWEQAAAVRELADHPLRPDNPILAASEPYAGRFVPYTVFWGLVKRLTGLGIFTTMGLAALANYGLFIVGLYRFVTRQFKSASLASFLLVTMLLVWGKGYAHANAYHLNMFLVLLPYVAFFSFGLSLLSLSYLAAYCKNAAADRKDTSWHNLVLYAATSIVCFLSHPVTGAFCYVAAAALLIARGNVRRALLMQAVPVLAVLACLVWPWFNYWHLFFEGTVGENLRANFGLMLATKQVRALGGALLGIVLLVVFAVRRRHLFVVWGFLMCLGVYVISVLAHVGFVARFIFFTVFFLHLAIALFFDWGFRSAPAAGRRFSRQQAVALVVAIGLLGLSARFRRAEFDTHLVRLEWRGCLVPAYRSPAANWFFLADHLSADDVVMTVPLNGWCMTAISGAKMVAPLHALSYILPGFVEEQQARQADVDAFFTGDISCRQRRALLAKYGATHILMKENRPDNTCDALERDLGTLATEVARDHNVVLYKLKADD